MSPNLRIAVVIPVRDRFDLLEQTLAGVTAQDFSLEDFEVLVCDDGSKENPLPILEKFAEALPCLRLLRQSARGPAAARNLGIRESAAPYILFLDSDTQPGHGLIRNLVRALDESSARMGAEARIEPVGGETNPLWDAPVCRHGGRYHTAAIGYRRSALLAAGGFDEAFALPAGEDVELAMRILPQGPIHFVPAAVIQHPRRPFTLLNRWRSRRHWKYIMILAKRYGILGFPGRQVGRFPRIRISAAALVTLPAGRFIQALRFFLQNPFAGLRAASLALFDGFCGLVVLPEILSSTVPPRRNYLASVEPLGFRTSPSARISEGPPPRSSISSSGRIAVVVCSHRWMDVLPLCLDKFQSMVDNPRDLIFIDNGSSEDLHRWAAERFSKIEVLRLPQNRMFCGGYNAGIRLVLERGYDFVLISNADTEPINPRMLTDMQSAADRWPQGVFFGPLVFWRSVGIVQKTCLQFPTPARQAEQWVPFRLFRHWVERQPLEERTVEFLNGVCVLCRVQALRQFGLMDETMGGYLEDADWAWRAQQQGWLSVYVPIPGVIHHEAPRGYEPYSLKSFLVKRNVVYWFLKNQKVPSACSYAYASLLLAGLRLLKAPSISEKQKHRYFFQRLVRAYSGLLRRESLGEWFGPPLGPWRHENVL